MVRSRFSHLRRVSFAVLLLLLLAAPTLLALDVPPPPTQWYTDKAGLLDSSAAEALNAKLAAFEQSSGAQFIIYVFPTLDDEALEDFTIRCAERWKVGNKKYDNGLILFVFVKERKLRIEVGYGLEPVVTDAFSSRVIREFITPEFRKGDYAGGLNAAADALMAQIQHKEPPVPPVRQRSAGGQTQVGGSIAGLIFFIIVLIFIASLVTRSRPGCSGCFWPLLFMGAGRTFGGGGWGGGRGGGGFGGFSGGGGGFGGGGASGGW
ncbi:MAG TPA: TPM domain-containing protein [Thermoanaerobaculia bacterium]|nr:TPM domain-containing protein [Thermoanaerobaculia bacterium]